MELTSRDRAILRDLWLFRYLTTKQVSRLHFGHVKLAQRRLRVLTQQRLVDRFRPGEQSGRSFMMWWYRLARSGAGVIAADEGLVMEDILPPVRHPATMAFLAHHSLLSDFRIWLRQACAASDGEFGYRFIPSYEEVREQGRRQRRVALSVPGDARLLIPDGVFSLDQADDKHALFLLEIDRGTEPLTGKHPSAIERKLVMYRAAFDSRAEERYAGMFETEFSGFRILCIVPNEGRQHGFIRLAEKLDLTPLVWVATTHFIESECDLGRAVWAVRRDGPCHALTE